MEQSPVHLEKNNQEFNYKEQVQIRKYNRVIISSPPTFISQESISIIQQKFNVDFEQKWIYKEDFEEEFSVVFLNLTPVKAQVLSKTKKLEKALFVFLNYNSQQQTLQKIENYRQKFEQQKPQDKNLTPFFKCKDAMSIIDTQFKSLEGFQKCPTLTQDNLYFNQEFFSNSQQETDQQVADKLIDFLNHTKSQTKTVLSDIAYIIMTMSIPSSGKSTMRKQFKQLKQQNNNYYVGTLSTDSIVSAAMERLRNETLQEAEQKENKKINKFKIKYKEKEQNEEEQEIDEEELNKSDDEEQIQKNLQQAEEDEQLYQKALREVRGMFNAYQAGHFKRIYNNPCQFNLLYLDKNIIPHILQDQLQESHMCRRRQEVNPLTRRVVVLYPKVYDAKNLIPNFPFSYGFIIQCFKRVLFRKNHETLEGRDALKIAVLIRFIQAFRGIQQFDDIYFNKNPLIYKTISFPFINEESENIQIGKNIIQLINKLINVEKQELQQEIKIKPEVQDLLQVLKEYELKQINQLEQQQNFDNFDKSNF